MMTGELNYAVRFTGRSAGWKRAFPLLSEAAFGADLGNAHFLD
jgi:hypothetical protein